MNLKSFHTAQEDHSEGEELERLRGGFSGWVLETRSEVGEFSGWKGGELSSSEESDKGGSCALVRNGGDSNEVGGTDVVSCKWVAADFDVEESDVRSSEGSGVSSSDGWCGSESRVDKISADAVL